MSDGSECNCSEGHDELPLHHGISRVRQAVCSCSCVSDSGSFSAIFGAMSMFLARKDSGMTRILCKELFELDDNCVWIGLGSSDL